MLKSLRRIHEDEAGLETLQVVMIIAIAAIFLALIKFFWADIKAWATKLVQAISGTGGQGGFTN
jgi:hypothetical protein